MVKAADKLRLYQCVEAESRQQRIRQAAGQTRKALEATNCRKTYFLTLDLLLTLDSF